MRLISLSFWSQAAGHLSVLIILEGRDYMTGWNFDPAGTW